MDKRLSLLVCVNIVVVSGEDDESDQGGASGGADPCSEYDDAPPTEMDNDSRLQHIIYKSYIVTRSGAVQYPPHVGLFEHGDQPWYSQ